MIAFGPVPSRRLGQSLGINNIPPKNCSYSCIYCQVGRTIGHTIELREFYALEEVVSEVSRRVVEMRERDEDVDFLTFVPDGEPTLDVHLEEAIGGLRGLGIPIAVISNGSLLWRSEVRAALRAADWVSIKVDSVCEAEWRRINRPHRALQLERVREGMLDFAGEFAGELATETMLIHGENDGEDSLGETASFVARLEPRTAYIGIPTRPTAEGWAEPASERAVTRAYQQFSDRVPRVELLTGYEGTGFGTSGDPADDLLRTTAVHPMREDAARELLRRGGSDGSVVEELVQQGELRRVQYRGHDYYVRRFPRTRRGDE